jgi:alanine-alpha-ketoisovalerate/valine-pyruvate aminotransferase
MATTFTWKIANAERTLANGMISVLHYTVDAFDGTYRAGAYGSVGLEPADEEEMIAFADLEEDICVEWVQQKLTEEKVEEIESALQKQLDEQKAPSVGTGLPWQG